MAKTLDSTNLVTSIKRRAMLPTNQVTFTTDDFLEMATEEILISLLPRLLELHEDYYLTSEETDLVASQSRYPIPYRATGDKLNDVFYVDDSGDFYEMTRIQIEHLQDYQGINSGPTYRYYYVENNDIVITPDLGSSVSGKLHFKFYMTPSELVQTSRAAQITAIDTSTGIITVDSVPTHFGTSLEYDFIKAKSPYKILTYDKSASTVNSVNKQMTFTASDLPSQLAVGDYVLKAQETIIPQIPVELHSVLAQLTAVACLEALGDNDNLQIAMKKLQKMENSLGIIIDNRVEGSPMKAVNNKSHLRLSSRGRRWHI